MSGQCIACVHWRLWELNQAGQRRWHGMAKHGFGECTVYPDAGRYKPPNRNCTVNQFEPIEPAQMHGRQLWLAKQKQKMRNDGWDGND